MTNYKPLEDFFEDYCVKVNITLTQLFHKSRRRELVEHRMTLAYILRKSLGMTYQEIGRALKKNHATIINLVKNMENFISVYPDIKDLYGIAEETLLDHKKYLIEFYNSPITTQLEREKKLVEILLENNYKLKSKIKQLKSELDGIKN
tara:strand:+ start:515 stop:958 length:444 start_codon:yes stop_codon:yes gene_type:complete